MLRSSAGFSAIKGINFLYSYCMVLFNAGYPNPGLEGCCPHLLDGSLLQHKRFLYESPSACHEGLNEFVNA